MFQCIGPSTVRLGDICATMSGGTPSRSEPNYFNGTIPWVKSGDLKDGHVDHVEERISQRGLEKSSAKLMPAGTVLIAMYGATIGKLGILTTEAATNQAICGITPPDTLDNTFLFYLLLSRRGDLIRMGAGGAQPNINQGIIRGLSIPVPPLSEQRRIVDLLSRAENVVRMRRQAEEKAKEIIPALFLDMFGRESPDPVVKVDDCLTSKKTGIRSGPFGSQLLHSEFTSEGIAVLGIDNAVNDRFEWSVRRFISPEKYKQLSRYTVHPGDVLITIMGTCGRCAIVPEGIPLTINTKHLCALTLASDRCLPEYLHGAFLFDPSVRLQLSAATKGAIMAGLNIQIIRNLRVQLPSIDRQAAYRVAVLRFDQMRRVAERALRTAEQAFQSLLAGVFGEAGCGRVERRASSARG